MFGPARSCLRSSGRFNSWRLASHVSLAASLSFAERVERHGKAAVENPHDFAFQAPDMIDIRHDALPDAADDRRGQCHATGGDVERLAGIFQPVRQHEPSEEMHVDPLVPAAVMLPDQGTVGGWLRGWHFAGGTCAFDHNTFSHCG